MQQHAAGQFGPAAPCGTPRSLGAGQITAVVMFLYARCPCAADHPLDVSGLQHRVALPRRSTPSQARLPPAVMRVVL
ncbi:hypothetical protein U9M48_003177 [Paspalum notatum var. saurae]|uniref:Uncharacterized protein n=1 Tax=Paspalum notatum var. saurae TaxID=547442 RepID=A0AAQ3PSV5_PASNO